MHRHTFRRSQQGPHSHPDVPAEGVGAARRRIVRRRMGHVLADRSNVVKRPPARKCTGLARPAGCGMYHRPSGSAHALPRVPSMLHLPGDRCRGQIGQLCPRPAWCTGGARDLSRRASGPVHQGTERHEAASTGHGPRFDLMVRAAPTFGPLDQWSRFQPNGQAPGTAPKGHFGAALKTAGHGQGTKWAQDGQKAKRRPCGPAHIQF